MNSPTSPNDVLAFIRCNCKQLLGSKFWQIRFVCKVDVGSKSEKLESKYVALSKFRLFFLSGKTTSKLQVDSSYNVLSIGEVNASQDHELLLGLDGRRLHLRLTDSGLSAMDVARKLLQAFKNYFPSCDPIRFMHLEPSSLYALFAVLPRSRPSLSCDGFRRTYAALCDFYKLPFRDEVVWDIEKIYTLQNASILRLDDFSHLFPKDLIPVIASLQFTSWFNGISAETFKLAAEIADVVITVVKKSQHLKTLILRNGGLKSDFLQHLASALNSNPTIPLDFIDFSGNTFDEAKAVAQFASALSNLTVGCRCLMFNECGLHSKSVNALCNALQKNQKRAAQKTIACVSFARNNLKSDVSELYHLLSMTPTLETLDISGTGISLEGVLQAMQSTNERISTCVLSGCTFSERKGKDLASSNAIKDFFANAPSLTNVDLSDSALPSDVLKFILLGMVCNPKVRTMRLVLTRSFADRQCISMLETCATNLAAVSDLVLRDLNLEQDALTLIRSFPLMPNLRRLDIGGNNFALTKKQQPKLLTNVMLEIAKVINDEAKGLHELVLSDSHLGVHLSVLLNALGVAPGLISLDISGNEFGNSGARLLAKALQLNSVLETLRIDRNQITHEGYADIAHALQGNYALKCIPYPLHDACESVKGNREKTEAILTEIEGLLQRNAVRSSSSSWTDPGLSTEAHNRLLLANVDDEVNKAVYSSEHLLAECKWKDSNHPDLAKVRTLLDDTEKAKKLLDEIAIPLNNRTEFVDDFVQAFLKRYMCEFEDKMKTYASKMSEIPGDKQISFGTDKNFVSALREASLHKTRGYSSTLDSIFGEFQEKLRQHFKQATFALACGAVEKVEQELLTSLLAANKNLDETQNPSASINSGGSMQSALSAVSPAPGTPKGKRKKFRLFSRSTRPKSIIESADGIFDSMDDALEDVAGTTPVDSCGDSLDSESFEVVDKPTGLTPDETGGNEESCPKLTHLVKDRPRLPYQRRHRATGQQRSTAKFDDQDGGAGGLDCAMGVDNFFSSSNNNNNRDQQKVEEPPPPELPPRRASRIPANAVPLIIAPDERVPHPVGKMHSAPRIPLVVTNENEGGRSAKRLSISLESPAVVVATSIGNEKEMLVSPEVNITIKCAGLTDSPNGNANSNVPAHPKDNSPLDKDGTLDSPPPRPIAPTPVILSPRSDRVMEEEDSATKGLSNTPPPRPPPPPSSKISKMRQPEITVQNMEVPEPVLRNKSLAATSSQNQTAAQRKSVLDLTAMFEHKPPAQSNPAGQSGPNSRPVPPPRPNKKSPA